MPALNLASRAAPDMLAVPAVGECHLWLVPVRARPDWTELLDQVERDRLARLPVPAARNAFITSRGAQRVIGSRYLHLPPAQVTISRDCQHCAAPHGRPRYPGSAVDYSVSHNERWVVAAVVGSGLAGVDIEGFDSCPDPEAVAPVTLTSAEREHFASLPPAERARWFFAAWTRKEAAMKLAGLGLAAAPDRLDVLESVLVVGDVARWPDVRIHLRALPAPHGHAAALATTVAAATIRSFVLP
jgi:4'-phosphopantetheinyl transferase